MYISADDKYVVNVSLWNTVLTCSYWLGSIFACNTSTIPSTSRYNSPVIHVMWTSYDTFCQNVLMDSDTNKYERISEHFIPGLKRLTQTVFVTEFLSCFCLIFLFIFWTETYLRNPLGNPDLQFRSHCYTQVLIFLSVSISCVTECSCNWGQLGEVILTMSLLRDS